LNGNVKKDLKDVGCKDVYSILAHDVSCEHGNKFWNSIKGRIPNVAELFLAHISCNMWSFFLNCNK